MITRQTLSNSQCWVIKVGSALLTNQSDGLNRRAIASWVSQIHQLKEQGKQVVLVSSGSIAEGMVRLGWQTRPTTLDALQAAAAVGQMGLVEAYESCFQAFGLHTAQVLLTHDDLSNRRRYLNARLSLKNLLSLGVVPIVNENDVVATDEIQFGDNDTLAGLVANLVEADTLVILTDQKGLYDANPTDNPNAKLIEEAMADDASLDAMAKPNTNQFGRGGMQTKLKAARIAARSGAATIIAKGDAKNTLVKIHQGETVGTLLKPSHDRLDARKLWLAGHLKVRGKVVLDAGAIKALISQNRSLLPIGVTQVKGSFKRGDMVACIDDKGTEVARGLVNYDSDDADKIKGVMSDDIPSVLDLMREPELIHRDNLVITK